MKRIILILCVATMSLSAFAQEFNKVPGAWKWISPEDVVFSYDGTYADEAAFAVNARSGKVVEGVQAPEKYSSFPVNPVGAVNLTYSPDSTKLARSEERRVGKECL